MQVVKKYYVNKLAPFNGDHVVHRQDCRHLPLLENSSLLGEFNDCKPAVLLAKDIYKMVVGCKECSPDCYTQFKLN